MNKDEDEDNQSMVQVVKATLGNLCDTETTEATGTDAALSSIFTVLQIQLQL